MFHIELRSSVVNSLRCRTNCFGSYIILITFLPIIRPICLASNHQHGCEDLQSINAFEVRCDRTCGFIAKLDNIASQRKSKPEHKENIRESIPGLRWEGFSSIKRFSESPHYNRNRPTNLLPSRCLMQEPKDSCNKMKSDIQYNNLHPNMRTSLVTMTAYLQQSILSNLHLMKLRSRE